MNGPPKDIERHRFLLTTDRLAVAEAARPRGLLLERVVDAFPELLSLTNTDSPLTVTPSTCITSTTREVLQEA